MTDQLHAMTPHDLAVLHRQARRDRRPDDRDGHLPDPRVLGVGNIYLQLHSLPERMAHKSQKLQFEIVAVLGLISLFTHMHIFWIAGLLLALVDLPDFSTPLAVSPDRSRRSRTRATACRGRRRQRPNKPVRRPSFRRRRAAAMFELMLCSMFTLAAGLSVPPLPAGQAHRRGDHACSRCGTSCAGASRDA